MDSNENTAVSRRVVVGVTGASGTTIACSVLRMLAEVGMERHLVVSPAARRTALWELPDEQLESLADVTYSWRDIGAPIVSGSFPTDGMIVVPCSINTLSRIAFGITDSLISRAADVTLKERRRLVLAVRESPLHLGHLRAISQVTEAGAIVAPALPVFYAKPRTVQELVDQMSARLVDLLGVVPPSSTPWKGDYHARHEARSFSAGGVLEDAALSQTEFSPQ